MIEKWWYSMHNEFGQGNAPQEVPWTPLPMGTTVGFFNCIMLFELRLVVQLGVVKFN